MDNPASKFSTKFHTRACLEVCMTTGKQACRGCADEYLNARRFYLCTFTQADINRIVEIEREEKGEN
jgi:hypothetical protein